MIKPPDHRLWTLLRPGQYQRVSCPGRPPPGAARRLKHSRGKPARLAEAELEKLALASARPWPWAASSRRCGSSAAAAVHACGGAPSAPIGPRQADTGRSRRARPQESPYPESADHDCSIGRPVFPVPPVSRAMRIPPATSWQQPIREQMLRVSSETRNRKGLRRCGSAPSIADVPRRLVVATRSGV